MPIVRVVSGREFDSDDEMISVPLESKHDLSKIRRGLPQLERAMREKWPTLTEVQIRHQLRRKNPIDPHDVVRHGPAIIAALFGSKIAVAVLKPSADEVGQYLRRWVRKFTTPKARKKKDANRRRTRREV